MGNFFDTSVLTGLGDIIKVLFGALASFVQVLLSSLGSTILIGLLDVFYWIFIWCPLTCINICIQLFRFFCTGFNTYLFSEQKNPDGSNSYKFDVTSPLYRIVMIVFVIALIMFFINFVFSFSKNNIIDEFGKPTRMQSKRFLTLKWPLLMFVVLMFTPFVLTFVDEVMTKLMSAFTKESVKSISTADINQMQQYITNNPNGLFYKMRGVNNLYVGSYNYAALLAYLKQTSVQLTTAIENQVNINTGINYIPVSSVFKYDEYLDQIWKTCDKLEIYITTTLPNDYAMLTQIVNSASPSDYLTLSDSNTIREIMGRMNEFQSNNFELEQIYTNIFNNETDAMKIRSFMQGDFTSSLLLSNIVDYDLKRYVDSLNANTTSSLGYYVGHDTNSIVNLICNGSNSFIGIREFATRSIRPVDPTIVKVLYQLSTGDPNGSNWASTHASSTASANFDIWRFVVCAMGNMSFILIAYSFTKIAIDRMFYIVYAWFLGWVYLANGIKDSNIPIKWYKKIYGRWFNVIIFFVLFQAASEISALIWQGVFTSLNSDPTMSGGFINAGNNGLAPTMLTIFAVQASFQVAYQFGNTASQQLWDVDSNNNFANNMIQSHTFSTGVKTFNAAKNNTFKALQSAQDIATGKVIRDKVVSTQSSLAWIRNNIGTVQIGRIEHPGDQAAGKNSGRWTIAWTPSNNHMRHDQMTKMYVDRQLQQEKKDKARSGSIRSDGKGKYEYVISSKTTFNMDGNSEVSWIKRQWRKRRQDTSDSIDVNSVRFNTANEALHFRASVSAYKQYKELLKGHKEAEGNFDPNLRNLDLRTATDEQWLAMKKMAGHEKLTESINENWNKLSAEQKKEFGDDKYEAYADMMSKKVADNYMKALEVSPMLADKYAGDIEKVDKTIGKMMQATGHITFDANNLQQSLRDSGTISYDTLKNNTINEVNTFKNQTDAIAGIHSIVTPEDRVSYEDQIKHLEARREKLLLETDLYKTMQDLGDGNGGLAKQGVAEEHIYNQVDQQIAKEREAIDKIYANEKQEYEQKKLAEHNDMSVVDSFTGKAGGGEFGTDAEIAANMGLMGLSDKLAQQQATTPAEQARDQPAAPGENEEVLGHTDDYDTYIEAEHQVNTQEADEIHQEAEQASNDLNADKDDGLSVANEDQSLMNGESVFDMTEDEAADENASDDSSSDNGGNNGNTGE